MGERLHSLDQFRGYTVAGMFLVNFLGGFAAIHPLLKHHNTYCSYADTIMPQFFFAVGMALRLASPRPSKLVKRALGLILVGAVVYHLDGKYATFDAMSWGEFFGKAWRRSLFQALVHIGVTTLWVAPVIAASARAQVLWMVGSAALHVVLSATWWHAWLRENRVIDGGALGFLTWTIPTLFGSLAYSYLIANGRAMAYSRFALASVAAMLGGYGLSCLTNGGVLAAPPFFAPWHERDMWTMSQQAGSVSYLLFSAGFSLAVYTLFIWLCDARGLRVGVFRTLGVNALTGYVLHMPVEDAVKPFAPRDSPLYWALAMFALFFTIVWAMMRSLEKNNVYIKL
jgi:predicted acyltransferase